MDAGRARTTASVKGRSQAVPTSTETSLTELDKDHPRFWRRDMQTLTEVLAALDNVDGEIERLGCTELRDAMPTRKEN